MISEAKLRLLQLPDIRVDQVQPIQLLVDSDRYDIPSDEIAEKLLGRTLSDQIE